MKYYRRVPFQAGAVEGKYSSTVDTITEVQPPIDEVVNEPASQADESTATPPHNSETPHELVTAAEEILAGDMSKPEPEASDITQSAPTSLFAPIDNVTKLNVDVHDLVDALSQWWPRVHAEIENITAGLGLGQVLAMDPVHPGQVVHLPVNLDNNTSAPVNVLIDLTKLIGPAGIELTDLVTQPMNLSVPAGGSSATTLPVKIPADAAPGDYQGIIQGTGDQFAALPVTIPVTQITGS